MTIKYPVQRERLYRPGRNKYNARKTQVDGKWFDSQGEAFRYLKLKAREQAGEIKRLRLQVTYPLKINDELICNYKADFVYIEGGRETVEDYKGVRTAVYRIKAKLMQALYGITILETGKDYTGD